MRTNSQGFSILSYGNRPDTDPMIVHIQRADLNQATDYNAVLYPDGKFLKEVASLDAARALASTIYIKPKKGKPSKKPANLSSWRKAVELDIRSTR